MLPLLAPISTEAARPTTERCASVAGGTNAETQARSTARRRKRSMAISKWIRREQFESSGTNAE